MTDQTLSPPPVMWAQRSAVIFLTVNLEDVKVPQIKSDNQLRFISSEGIDMQFSEIVIKADLHLLWSPTIAFEKGNGLVSITFPNVKFNKDSVYFRGTGGLEKKEYEVTIPLYKEIDPDKSKSFNRGRCIEILLAKAKQDEPYWPSLTSDKKKHHWLKSDFNKWHDEDDSGDEGVGGMGGGGDFEEMMRQMGGLGGGDKSYLDDLDEGGDSDDEPIPDLE